MPAPRYSIDRESFLEQLGRLPVGGLIDRNDCQTCQTVGYQPLVPGFLCGGPSGLEQRNRSFVIALLLSEITRGVERPSPILVTALVARNGGLRLGATLV